MAVGLHPCVTKAANLQTLLEVGLVEGDYLSEDVYEFLNFGMHFLRSDEGLEYWYHLNPKPFPHRRPPRPWTEADREMIEGYLGDYAQQPIGGEDDLWL